MECKNLYSNEELKEAVDIFEPAHDMAFSETELPDFFCQIINCEFWGDKNDSAFLNDENSSNLIGILNKALPSPCKGRSVTNKIPDSWIGKNGDKTVFNAIIRIIFAGLLGIYDHCEKRANFIARRKLYFWFCLNLPEDELMDKWVGDNKHLVVYILREFVFYCVENVPSLCHYMEKNYYWAQMRKNTFNAMDTVRDHINSRAENNSSDFLGGWFTGLQSIMDSFNKNNLGFCHRPITIGFLDTMVDIIKKLDDFYFKDPNFTLTEEQFSKEEEENLKNVVDLFSTSDNLSFEWLLIEHKVKLENILVLRDAQDMYEGEISRSMIINVMKEMAKKNPRDYIVIKTFFMQRKKKFMIMFYPLPLHITKQQIESYHSMYQTIRGQKLNENAGVYYACPNCGELKAKVMPKDVTIHPSSHIKERERTLSNEKTSIDMKTGKIYCSKPPSKTTPKKRTVAADTVCEMIGAEKDKKKELKKQSKDNRKKTMRQNCPQTELIKFNFIGKIIRTEKYGLVIVCPWCLCLTTFGRFSFEGSNGELSCGCKRVAQTIDYDCVICEKNCTSPKMLKFYLAYDDERDDPCICYVGICKDHQAKWIKKWDTILCVSVIKEAINKSWTSIPIDFGNDRMFIENKRQKFF